MDEIYKTVGIIVIIALTLAVLSALVFTVIKDRELQETRADLQSATRKNTVLRGQIADSRKAVRDLEERIRERERKIAELEGEVYELIDGNRRREEIIAGLEAEVSRLGGYTKSLGGLALEGKRIVEKLLEESGEIQN